ncbi:hypothetical protein C4544_00370 [candidate division WS5 bacterium]|uniref:Chorismate mutase domain-containing protein n=1 Tax=candidate division WS5 bacterium TaxID=2093353 RepID=A0A419DGT7_9BACT|nr:MAG: hypothetical protein C4544_00370 [candidate division WS5 bacterium]
MELPEIRQKIDDIDNQIFDLITDRVELARDVVKEKERIGKPIYDAEREKFVVGSKVDKAKDLGLPTDFIADIYKAIIHGCTEVEEKLKS